MSDSLMQHESAQRDLASKLVMMKNQIMVNDIGKSVSRKFAAVKIGTLMSAVPVSVRLYKIIFLSLNFANKVQMNTLLLLKVDKMR